LVPKDKKREKMKHKELYRSKKKRLIAGVCGGLGDFLGTDPTIIRLSWALITILSLWIGVVGYVLSWIIIPEEGSYKNSKSSKKVNF